MCGIVTYWERESELLPEQWDVLLKGAAERGRDGAGIVVCEPKSGSSIGNIFPKPVTDEVIQSVQNIAELSPYRNSVTQAIFRATPETEPPTSKFNMQPLIITDGKGNLRYSLVHNGSVTDSIIDELRRESEEKRFNFRFKVDSEGILASYIMHGHNMRKTMEYLSGAFAFTLLDVERRKLFIVSGHNPLAHGYIKGQGYIVHSNVDAIRDAIRLKTGASYDGMHVWEYWYAHEIEGHTIIETDLDSGFQSKCSYKPNYLYPKSPKSLNPSAKKIALVSASGGIDSGLSAHILKLAGLDTRMIHFRYGNKGGAAEEEAIEKLGEKLEIPVKIIHSNQLFWHDIQAGGMLIDYNIDVTSGGGDLKSTIAWVAGRNMVFASILLAKAEALILSGQAEEVYISAGWHQLSEETGGYPDNSHKFLLALEEMKKYGTIVGDKIHFLPVLQNLTKTEEWILGDALNFPFELTVSCDEPKWIDDEWVLCSACGSTKMSRIAAKRAGVEDKRLFDNKYPEYLEGVERVGTTSLEYLSDLIKRINIPTELKSNLAWGAPKDDHV